MCVYVCVQLNARILITVACSCYLLYGQESQFCALAARTQFEGVQLHNREKKGQDKHLLFLELLSL
jgi:hypothetical protein